MALTMRKTQALIVLSFAILSFIFGFAASLMKDSGVPWPMTMHGVTMTCKFSYDSPVVVLMEYLSLAFRGATTVAGCVSLFKSKRFMVVKLILAVMIAKFLILPSTITQRIHFSDQVHYDLKYDCHTDSPMSLLTGAGYSLVLGLFWCGLLFAHPARQN